MAFIRKKKTSARRVVYQVVESRREGRKVRQTVLASLMYDSTIAAAIVTLERRIADNMAFLSPYNAADVRRRVALQREHIERLRQVQQQTGLL